MKPTRPFLRKPGFALVTTLLMMTLLSAIIIGTLSLSSVTLRSTEKNSHRAIAQANARMALTLAIAQLQREAGPDQRITASAGITGNTVHPHWTGVWKSTAGNDKPEPVWLVSGSPGDARQPLLPTNSTVLVSSTEKDLKNEIRAPWIKVPAHRGSGRFAYWTADEGVKARIDLAAPDADSPDWSDTEKLAHSQSAQEPGLGYFDATHREMWTPFLPEQASLNKSRLVSMGTASLAVNDSPSLKRSAFSRHYFNDLTTGGYGLPVNARDGGMKHDLSLIFARSMQDEPFVSDFLGATPSTADTLGEKVLTFSISDPEKFGLSPTIQANHSGGFVGPNWGTLFNYARSWEKLSGNEAPLIGPHPLADTDLRQDDWQPYSEANKGMPNRADIQHLNSGISPVLSVAQIGFYLGAEEAPSPPGSPQRYYTKLMIKPIVGLWNPYNVKIRANQYLLEWAIASYMRFDYQKPNPDGSFPSGSGNVVEIWLREYWLANEGGNFPTDDSKQSGSYLRMLTRPVDFEPGEHRLFSVEGNPEIADGYNNYLTPTLDPMGAYAVRIIRTVDGKLTGPDGKILPDQKKGQPLFVPSGYYGWFGDVYFQDTHWDGSTKTHGVGTRSRFPGLDRTAASTWLSLKGVSNVTPEGPGNATHLSRYTNLWNGGKDETAKGDGRYIPEPILTMRSKINVSGAGGRTPYLIDTLAEGTLGHIGTWRFYTRNPTELSDPAQGLRGWIDCNPRVIASNLRFDGSKNTLQGVEGWHATSHLMPGLGDVSFGDFKGGNRGLVSDGSWGRESRIPEGEPIEDRWRGYGGPGSTLNSGGQTHVIVYDVPRTPLLSIGQFQHANLSRYNHEPGFVVGNSYANPRIPPDKTVHENFGGMGFPAVDTSYEVNERLWDGMFFSTLSPDDQGDASGDFDAPLKATLSGKKPLPNPRMDYTPLPGDPVDRNGIPSVQQLIRRNDKAAPQALAARIRVKGAFNVNSTSETAWKAILSSMASSGMPVVNPSTAQTSWSTPRGIRFNRFSHTILDAGYDGGDGDAAFWQGWRKLSEEDLEKLASAIVRQVKERGPFMSLASFVNRSPSSQKREHQLKGPLQAALDEIANHQLPSSTGQPANNPTGEAFSDTIDGENQAAGHAAYLLQGDLLQSLAPILQVRSDYFRIRTCGESLDASGRVMARAHCEAFVQRDSSFVDPRDPPHLAAGQLRAANQTYGRKFQLVSFRWLLPEEI